MLNKLWKDEAGIVALEYLLLATVVGLALVVGLNATASALNVELVELANAISSLDQSYSFDGHSTCNSTKAGSAVTDAADAVTYGTPTVTAVGIDQTICGN
jgi:Flp pilus assembly pilin Flp